MFLYYYYYSERNCFSLLVILIYLQPEQLILKYLIDAYILLLDRSILVHIFFESHTQLSFPLFLKQGGGGEVVGQFSCNFETITTKF